MLKNFQNSFRNMANITSFPRLTIPNIYNMSGAFGNCPNLTGPVPMDLVIPKAIVWDNTFQYDTKITSVPIEFFTTGSSYVFTFRDCKGLLGLTDSSLKDNFTFPGWTLTNTFRGCTNFRLPLANATSTSIRLTFPDARAIAGFFYMTNALGSSTLVRYALIITANYAKYADIFLDDEPKVNPATRQFNRIEINMARLVGGQFFLGAMSLKENLKLSVLTPDNDDAVNHNMLPYLTMTRGTVNLNIIRDPSVAEMYTELSVPMRDLIRYYIWNEMTLENIVIPMTTINEIQQTVVSCMITFIGCTFTNPTAISQLNNPGVVTTFVWSDCTSVEILRECLTPNHRLIP